MVNSQVEPASSGSGAGDQIVGARPACWRWARRLAIGRTSAGTGNARDDAQESTVDSWASWPSGRRIGSGEVEPVQFHDLRPDRHEVGHEALATVVAGVDLGQRAQL